MATLHSNGRDLHYTDTGGDGPAVILGHGYFLDGTMFDAQAAALAPHWRVLTVDARGHGGTPDDGEPFTYWDAARDVLGLMDALGIASAAVGGVSQGGFIALRAALLAPDRVTSLLLFDTEAEPVGEQARAGYLQLFDALRDHGPTDDLLYPLAHQIVGDHPAAATWIQKWREASQLPLGTPVGALLDRDDIVGRLPDITCPALLVRGELDASLPAERLTTLHQHLPHATKVHTVQGAWHSPPLTHPEAVTELLMQFLSGSIPAR
jgi:pimeloyl-ACP methyl ester carboxylesterase